MMIKQKIWSIPILAILIFSIGSAVTYQSSSYTQNLLENTKSVHYPFLHHIQILSDDLVAIQDNFLDALDTNRELGITRARHNAEDFRKTALEIAKIKGKKDISQEIMMQFDEYFSAADNAASTIIGIKQGNWTAEMKHMIIAMNKLTNTLQRENLSATNIFDQSLSDSNSNVQHMLQASLISAFIVLAGLVFTSYRLITSIITSLEQLNTGARKIAQGDFTSEIPVRGSDELTSVALTFNSMTRALKTAAEKHVQHEIQLEKLNRELEQRVQARTSELTVALEEANKANAAVAYMADHDSLTGLLSRRRFQDEFDRWAKYALRYDRPMSLMFIDLDHFKAINDNHGHLGGDEYLRGVAELLKKTLRSTDYIGRWGGDEFAALLPETTSAAACETAAKLIKMLCTEAITVSGKSMFASASIGIASLPEHATDVSELTAFADAAMYKAKDAGRGCFNLYSASEVEIQHLGEHARWAGRIRRALEADQFVLFYQPVLHLRSFEISEYEALLRLEDQNGEFISPSQFLASAERFDLCIAIDRMVIKKAAHKIATLKTQGDPMHLSLNLSASFLNDPGAIEYIRSTIHEFYIDPACLAIELSEAIILQNLERVCNLSHEISQLGCRFILDDIGVGFSSFQYLAPLSIRSIKIKGELIRNLHIGSNREYLNSLCKTCHGLNIEVVAKFVEDYSQLDPLREIGVDFAQGFALGRPLESMNKLDEAG